MVSYGKKYQNITDIPYNLLVTYYIKVIKSKLPICIKTLSIQFQIINLFILIPIFNCKKYKNNLKTNIFLLVLKIM